MTDDTARRTESTLMRLACRTTSIAIAATACGLAAVSSPAVAASAHPAAATTSSNHHHRGGRHHHGTESKRTTIDGLVMSAHKSRVTVLASSARIGQKTTHDTVVHLTFGHHPRQLRRMHQGYEVHLVASAHGSARHLAVPKLRQAHVMPSPASVVVGVVDRVSDGQLVVSQLSRDNGDHSAGTQQHRLTIDTSGAKQTVDGGNGRIRANDLVAVLGETVGDSVLASRVVAFSQAPDALAGTVSKVDAAKVAVHNKQGRTSVTLGQGDGQVALFLDGSSAATDQLRDGDRIVVLGAVSEDEEGFTPVVAFAFDGHDDGPCGDNPLPSHHHAGN
jgi:hypothetical protein